MQDSYGDTVLHDAIAKDFIEIVEVLVNFRGVDLSIKNKRGFNCLHHAALKGNARSVVIFETEKGEVAGGGGGVEEREEGMGDRLLVCFHFYSVFNSDNNNNNNLFFIEGSTQYLSIIYTWPSEKINKEPKNQSKTMIYRQEFEDKLTKELLKTVHYNLQISIRLSLFSKDIKVKPLLRKSVPQACSTEHKCVRLFNSRQL